MADTGTILIGAAAGMGLIHTLAGPDHYLPFIMMSRARGWGMAKTLTITVLCGIGHVLSSVVLGMLGIAAGYAIGSIEGVEGTRGEIAAWLLIAFGLVYAIWGFRRARRGGKGHTHLHLSGVAHSHGHDHDYTHTHGDDHDHSNAPATKANVTPWVLFVIFVLGPCEPLIPILMYPAAEHNIPLLLAVTTVFCLVTVGTMTVMVATLSFGVKQLHLGFAEKYMHAIAGMMIFASGLAIQFLGL